MFDFTDLLVRVFTALASFAVLHRCLCTLSEAVLSEASSNRGDFIDYFNLDGSETPGSQAILSVVSLSLLLGWAVLGHRGLGAACILLLIGINGVRLDILFNTAKCPSDAKVQASFMLLAALFAGFILFLSGGADTALGYRILLSGGAGALMVLLLSRRERNPVWLQPIAIATTLLSVSLFSVEHLIHNQGQFNSPIIVFGPVLIIAVYLFARYTCSKEPFRGEWI